MLLGVLLGLSVFPRTGRNAGQHREAPILWLKDGRALHSLTHNREQPLGVITELRVVRQNSPQFKSNKKKTNGGFVMSDFGRTNTFLSVIRSIFAAHLSLSICPSKTGFVLVLHCLPTLFLQLLFSPSLLVWRACTQTSLTICCHKVVCVFIYVHVCMCVCFLQEQCKVRGKEYFSFLLAE